jgi:hypothetical protein
LGTLLLSYDLNRPGQAYDKLIEQIKGLGTNWWHCLDSTWLISTTLAPMEVATACLPLMDANDELFVVDVTGKAAAWRFPDEKCGKWLQDNL